MSNFPSPDQYANDEDYFTGCFYHLIKQFPKVGQKVVDLLFAHTNRPAPQFLGATDHPSLSTKDRPDFLLRCKGLNIICEHKLDSPLGNQQLERYLELASQQQKKTYLACISRGWQHISPKLLDSKSYLHPGHNRHFRWRDIYPIVERYSHSSAQEFRAMMDDYRMKPSNPIQGWEGLFSGDPETTTLFRQQWDGVRNYFKDLGAEQCSLDGEDQFGFRVGYPLEWLHLIYLSAREGSHCPLPSASSFLYANIWLPEKHLYYNQFNRVGRTRIPFRENSPIIMRKRTITSMRLESKKRKTYARCRAMYYTDLASILSPCLKTTQQSLLDFTIAVFEHVQLCTTATGRPKILYSSDVQQNSISDAIKLLC